MFNNDFSDKLMSPNSEKNQNIYFFQNVYMFIPIMLDTIDRNFL